MTTSNDNADLAARLRDALRSGSYLERLKLMDEAADALESAPLSRSGDSALVEAVRLLKAANGLYMSRALSAEIDKFIQQHGERK